LKSQPDGQTSKSSRCDAQPKPDTPTTSEPYTRSLKKARSNPEKPTNQISKLASHPVAMPNPSRTHQPPLPDSFPRGDPFHARRANQKGKLASHPVAMPSPSHMCQPNRQISKSPHHDSLPEPETPTTSAPYTLSLTKTVQSQKSQPKGHTSKSTRHDAQCEPETSTTTPP
jgi:hypothetical protein